MTGKDGNWKIRKTGNGKEVGDRKVSQQCKETGKLGKREMLRK